METEPVQENELSKRTVAAIATVCVVVFLVIVALVVYYCYFAKRKGAPRFQCWPCKLPFPTCCSPFRKKTAKKQQKKQRQRERERKHEEIQALSREDALKELEGSRAAQNYEYALDYVNEHPPDESEGTLAEDDTEHVIEHGVNAWEFIPSYDNTNITVLDNTDVEFVGGEQSVMTNLQFPNEQRVYYFEVRLDRLPEGTNVAVGAAMHGYPPLRMAGWANNSVAYHSADGHVYYCHPLDITRKTTTALQSDTLGVGWRPHSGKMFFVINGAIMAHVRTPWINKRMYPIISADGPCNVSVNLGARAYVLSHANMRFWGLAAAEGARPPPPMYHQTQDTTLVASTDNEHAGTHSGWRNSLGLHPPPAYEDSA
ncbi:Protein ssh4, partial [Linderina pennispora]